MIIGGCDFHPGWQQVAVFDSATGEIREEKLENGNGEAERFYRRLPSPARVGFEKRPSPAAPTRPGREAASAIASGLAVPGHALLFGEGIPRCRERAHFLPRTALVGRGGLLAGAGFAPFTGHRGSSGRASCHARGVAGSQVFSNGYVVSVCGLSGCRPSSPSPRTERAFIIGPLTE